MLHSFLRIAVVVLLLAAALPAQAFQLVPITQDFEPSGRGATKTFQLQNEAAEPVAITVTMVTRTMDENGEEQNAETEDFIVVPEQAVVPARGVQTVRVQFIGEPNPSQELAYRIVAEQVPVAFTQRPRGGAVQVIVRYVGSVYVLPKGAQAELTLEGAAPKTLGGKPQLELSIANLGNAHGIVDDPVLKLTAGGKTRELGEADLPGLAGTNILAKSKRRILLPWPADLPVGPVQAALTARPTR